MYANFLYRTCPKFIVLLSLSLSPIHLLLYLKTDQIAASPRSGYCSWSTSYCSMLRRPFLCILANYCVQGYPSHAGIFAGVKMLPPPRRRAPRLERGQAWAAGCSSRRRLSRLPLHSPPIPLPPTGRPWVATLLPAAPPPRAVFAPSVAPPLRRPGAARAPSPSSLPAAVLARPRPAASSSPRPATRLTAPPRPRPGPPTPWPPPLRLLLLQRRPEVEMCF